MIPDVYDAETTANLAYIYDLWTNPTPGYEEDNWIGNKYRYTDDRAVDETYATLRESEHCAVDRVLLVGSVSDLECADFLWSMSTGTPAELLEAKMPIWQGLCDEFNSK